MATRLTTRSDKNPEERGLRSPRSLRRPSRKKTVIPLVFCIKAMLKKAGMAAGADKAAWQCPMSKCSLLKTSGLSLSRLLPKGRLLYSPLPRCGQQSKPLGRNGKRMFYIYLQDTSNEFQGK